MKYLIGTDIGGTHISAALINLASKKLDDDSQHEQHIDAQGDKDGILKGWSETLKKVLENGKAEGIGVAMPGPFDYEKGISYIKDQHKYDALYQVNVKEALLKSLDLKEDFPFFFENDAICFALGEHWAGSARGCEKSISITLGTGFGACFLDGDEPLKEGEHVPDDGTLYDVKYKDGIAEDYFSTRWFVKRYEALSGEKLKGVKKISELAGDGEEKALNVFKEFADNFAEFIAPWLKNFGADCLVIGGSISKAEDFFLGRLKKHLEDQKVKTEIRISALREQAAMIGAARMAMKKLQ